MTRRFDKEEIEQLKAIDKALKVNDMVSVSSMNCLNNKDILSFLEEQEYISITKVWGDELISKNISLQPFIQAQEKSHKVDEWAKEQDKAEKKREKRIDFIKDLIIAIVGAVVGFLLGKYC